MRDVSIIGIGQTPVGEHWDYALRHLALEAIRDAANDAHIDHADALFVGNMAGAQIGGQTNLGALIADFVGLRGIEAVTVEASSASGGAALRQAYLGVASGAFDFPGLPTGYYYLVARPQSCRGGDGVRGGLHDALLLRLESPFGSGVSEAAV